MKTIIAGPRNIHGKLAEDLVNEAMMASGWMFEITEIIHGDAPGIDSAADRLFTGVFKVTPVPADWDAHGRAAGPIRNRKMAEMADALLAVWDGSSRGTGNMIQTAKKLGLRVYVHMIKKQ